MEVFNSRSLKPYSTFGIEAKAGLFVECNKLWQILQVLEQFNREPLLILGGGSNILFTKDVEGLVLKNELPGITAEAESDDFMLVKAGAGENWHQFVRYCIQQNWGGIENLSLIPGNVGAAPMQNIGAYGVEIKDNFYSLEALDLKTGNLRTFSAADCKFAYRESVFKRDLKNRYLITSVCFRLSRKNHQLHTEYGAIRDELKQGTTNLPDLLAISDAVIRIRQSKLPDPAKIGNAGSFFKNPVVEQKQYEQILEQYPDLVSYPAGEQKHKLAAGWLIEKAGWKGYRKGDAGVHARQALVLVNYGNASGKEILQLSQDIISDIQQKFGVILEREVNIY
ncbi:MAG: UDP-N-acetylmuramate dehydrogenase [Bacteroidia bacterium]|nr:UDP-N-acetylmuramate dehydrogenase [Bacteroidia bacterium]